VHLVSKQVFTFKEKFPFAQGGNFCFLSGYSLFLPAEKTEKQKNPVLSVLPLDIPAKPVYNSQK